MYILKKLKNNKHKFEITTPTKKIKFGDSLYEDFTIHKDEERMKRYLKRHAKEDWNDLNSKGMWSRYLLWSKPTIRRAINYIQKKFGITIKYKR